MPELDFFSVDAELDKQREFADRESNPHVDPQIPDVSSIRADEIAAQAQIASEKYAKRHPEATESEVSAFYCGYQAALIDSI